MIVRIFYVYSTRVCNGEWREGVRNSLPSILLPNSCPFALCLVLDAGVNRRIHQVGERLNVICLHPCIRFAHFPHFFVKRSISFSRFTGNRSLQNEVHHLSVRTGDAGSQLTIPLQTGVQGHTTPSIPPNVYLHKRS